MTYTAYELYETGKKVYNLIERVQSGEDISDEEIESVALELGIEAATGIVTSKLKLVEKIVSAADGVLKKTGLDTKVQKLIKLILDNPLFKA